MSNQPERNSAEMANAEDVSRRDLLRNVALAATLGGLEPLAAQHVHQMAAADKKGGVYTPKLFKEMEWKSVEAFAEVVMPGASKGGAKEFIDLICGANPTLAATWTGGLSWMAVRLGKPFHLATAAEQTALLDQIAFRKNNSPALAAGINFFDLARRMVVDAYYTSAVGTAELGYLGNKGMSEFKVPGNAVAYAMRRAGLA